MSESPGIVLVSGCALGLGAAVAVAVEEAGGTAVSLDIRPPADGIDHEVVDVTDTPAVWNAVERVAARHGRIDAVVAAAGIDRPGAFGDVPAEEWERVVAVNLVGAAAVVRAALPYVERSRGRVVTVASTLGFRVFPDATAYCASKFGLVGFTRALAAETAGRIGVTLLVPGGMRTSFFDDREERYKPGAGAELNRPENVAHAVLFALRQPAGCEVRELVVAPGKEPSWP